MFLRFVFSFSNFVLTHSVGSEVTLSESVHGRKKIRMDELEEALRVGSHTYLLPRDAGNTQHIGDLACDLDIRHLG
jgi:hypothetical protein